MECYTNSDCGSGAKSDVEYNSVGMSSCGGFKRRDWKPPGSDSGQNSLDCWDYTVELEMLKGPSDLHLAAELGKTLLERNRELETSVRELRLALDDKTQEVEYLSKQTTALREVNDSRLRIYEQLEISIQDLEKINQRLSAENTADKRKIKSLNEIVEHLEGKCEELKTSQAESAFLRESGSTFDGNGTQRGQKTSQAEEILEDEVLDLKSQVEELQVQIKATQKQYMSEIKRREDLEIELSCISQENDGLKEQLEIYKDGHFTSAKNFDDEFTSPDTTTSSMLCRKCMGLADETGSNLTMQDINEDFEELNEMIEAPDNDCTLIRLKNGGYAWGSQESMTSLGLVRSRNESKNASGTSAGEKPHNSLLSELDSQYRILIEKYESLVQANQRDDCELANEQDSLVHMGVDEDSGPMGFLMTTAEPDNVSVEKQYSCRRCENCTCTVKAPTGRKTKHSEDFGEADTASSGFSEEERRFSAKSTQTEAYQPTHDFLCGADDAITPVANKSNFQYLDLKSPINPCETRFQNAPDVQKLFSEIFENLKKTSSPNCENKEPFSANSFVNEDINSRKSRSSNRKSNKENEKPIEEINEKQSNEITDSITRPIRPDSLDIETVSTCSSRSRRRRRQARAKSHEKSKGNQKVDSKHGKRDLNDEPQTLKEGQEVHMVEKVQNSESLTAVPHSSKSSSSGLQMRHSNTVDEVSKEAPDKTMRIKCPHKQRKKKRSKSKTNQLQNKHLNAALGRSSPSRSPSRNLQSYSSFSKTAKVGSAIPNKNPLPSVQVAKLIRVERSYAEVLKSKTFKC